MTDASEARVETSSISNGSAPGEPHLNYEGGESRLYGNTGPSLQETCF